MHTINKRGTISDARIPADNHNNCPLEPEKLDNSCGYMVEKRVTL